MKGKGWFYPVKMEDVKGYVYPGTMVEVKG
jgi:hypothetical protein